MAGMCRHTGKRLDGWDHIEQSLEVIFSTRIGTRIGRRSFGSSVPDLIDAPATAETILDHFEAIANSLDQFEPRVLLNGFDIQKADEAGNISISVNVTEVSTGSQRAVEVAL